MTPEENKALLGEAIIAATRTYDVDRWLEGDLTARPTRAEVEAEGYVLSTGIGVVE